MTIEGKLGRSKRRPMPDTCMRFGFRQPAHSLKCGIDTPRFALNWGERCAGRLLRRQRDTRITGGPRRLNRVGSLYYYYYAISVPIA
jgi:hypothetical protein